MRILGRGGRMGGVWRVVVIAGAALCVAGGMGLAGGAMQGPRAVRAAAGERPAPTNPLTWTVFLPLIRGSVNVQFSSIGYDCCPKNGCPETCEHIHFRNYGASAVNITGWRINSPATGDSYTFPSASAPPYSSTQKEITLNSHNTGFVDNVYIFNWNNPHDEWPSNGGVAYLFDANNNLVSTCTYAPTNDGTGNAAC